MSSPRSVQAILAEGAPVFRAFLTAVVLQGQATADAVGLGPTDFYALNLVGAFGPLTAGQLATHTGLSTGSTTRLIDRLEEAGYINRVADPGDRRKVLIELVAEQRTPIAAATEPARRQLGEVFLSCAPEQLDVLFDFFARATSALRAASVEMRGRAAATPETGSGRSLPASGRRRRDVAESGRPGGSLSGDDPSVTR